MPDLRICRRFGETLKRTRIRLRLSQDELAGRASLHRTEIAKLEGGARIPRLDTIVKLAGGLEASPCELLDGMAWKGNGFGAGDFVISDSEVVRAP
jgi:transcriptional regulator with XRE-family HTH domain